MSRGPSGDERIEAWLGPAGAAYGIIRPIVGFLANPLDEVTGDPDRLRETAQAWRGAADRMESLARDELDARRKVLGAWEGDAATAFDQEMAELNACLGDIAGHFVCTAELLENSAEGAQQAQDLVEQIVRELIAWLIVTIIVALASAWITAGASVAVGAAAGATEAAFAGTRAAAVALRFAELLRKLATFLKKMSDFAKAYKITTLRTMPVKEWAAARYASTAGYQLLGTNWAIKKGIVEPVAGGPIDRLTGADNTWNLPQVF